MCIKQGLCILGTFASSLKKNPQANHSFGIWTHDLCTARAGVLTLAHWAKPKAVYSHSSFIECIEQAQKF